MTDRPTAIVTGASRGIGRAIALALAGEGHAVLVNYRTSRDAADEVCNLIREKGAPCEPCQADVTDAKQRVHVVDSALKAFGRIDVLVNNAGIAPAERKDILETDEPTYDRVLDANLKSVYFMTQLVARHMVEFRKTDAIPRGTLINISSIRSYTSADNYGEYCISKAGVGMVTRLFAHRLAPFDIRVFEISPGVIDTDMTRVPSVRQYYQSHIETGLAPINRLGRPEEVGRVAAAIARGDFPYCTGQVFHIDGGWHLRHL